MSVVTVAKKWVGYLEHQDSDLLSIPNANIGKGSHTIFAEIIAKHYPWRVFQGLPWCAVFVHAVFLEALGKNQSKRILGKPWAGTRLLARRMKNKGLLRDKDYLPKPGDIIFLTNSGSRVEHCGIVIHSTPTTVITIEGNTVDPSGHFEPDYGGAVAQRERELSDPKIINFAEISCKFK